MLRRILAVVLVLLAMQAAIAEGFDAAVENFNLHGRLYEKCRDYLEEAKKDDPDPIRIDSILSKIKKAGLLPEDDLNADAVACIEAYLLTAGEQLSQSADQLSESMAAISALYQEDIQSILKEQQIKAILGNGLEIFPPADYAAYCADMNFELPEEIFAVSADQQLSGSVYLLTAQCAQRVENGWLMLHEGRPMLVCFVYHGMGKAAWFGPEAGETVNIFVTYAGTFDDGLPCFAYGIDEFIVESFRA